MSNVKAQMSKRRLRHPVNGISLRSRSEKAKIESKAKAEAEAKTRSKAVSTKIE